MIRSSAGSRPSGTGEAGRDVGEWAKSTLGCDVYGFASIFEAAREESLKPPKSDAKLEEDLSEHLYVEGEMLYKPHALQVLTDDDEIELAYYLFDDHYLQEHPGRAAYLLHDDWRLPTSSGDRPEMPSSRTTDDPSVGLGFGGDVSGLPRLLRFDAPYPTSRIAGPCRIDGVRLPQLGDYLEATLPDEDWPFELKLLRSQLHAADSTEARLKAAL